MKIQDFTVLFQSEPEGGFTVMVPSLPGCVSYGKTLEEAKRMITDAIQGYIASLKKHEEIVPPSDTMFIGTVHVPGTEQSSAYA